MINCREIKEIDNPDDIKRIVETRDRNHHKNAEGFRAAEPMFASEDPHVIRGSEQIKIEQNGGAQSSGGTSSNTNNSIYNKNPKKDIYLDAAKKFLKERQE